MSGSNNGGPSCWRLALQEEQPENLDTILKNKIKISLKAHHS